MSSGYCTYRCKACRAFLTVGPTDAAGLRMIKYRHDRDACPDYDGPALLHENGLNAPALYFDNDDAWAKNHAALRHLDQHLQTTCYVGHAVPK